MSVSFRYAENTLGKSGINFYNDSSDDLLFIPNEYLFRVEQNYKILDIYEVGDVLIQVIRLYKCDWTTLELVNEFTAYLYQKYPSLSENLIADTFRAIKELKRIKKLEENYISSHPHEYETDASKIEYYFWKNKLQEYIRKKYSLIKSHS